MAIRFAQASVFLWLKRGAALLAATALLAFAALVATIALRDFSTLEREFVARLQSESGASIRYRHAEIRYWPRPRILLDQVEIDHPRSGSRLSAERATLRPRLLDLIEGRIRRPDIRLSGARIEALGGGLLAAIKTPQAFVGLTESLISSFDGVESLLQLRIAIDASRVTLINPAANGDDLVITPVSAILNFSGAKGRVDLQFHRNSELNPFTISASVPTRTSFGRGRAVPFHLQVSGYGSRAVLTGSLGREPDLAMIGTLDATLDASLEKLIGLNRHGGTKPTSPKTTIRSDMSLDKRGLGFQALRIARDGHGLTGVAALRENNGRWNLVATLAGDLFDGRATEATLAHLQEAEGRWVDTRLALNPLPAFDLDLRISTRQFRFGGVVLDDVALAMFTRGERVEFAIADAKFGTGSFKGRISLSSHSDSQDIKLLVSGDRIDIGAFLDKAVGIKTLRGTGLFVMQAESRGSSVRELMAAMTGTARIDLRNGELVGIDLKRLMSPSGSAIPELALSQAMGGASAYELLSANFVISKGRFEPVGSQFIASKIQGGIEGAIDLGNFRHELSATLRRSLESGSESDDLFAFRIEGPLFSPRFRLDKNLLPKRG